MAAGRRSPRSCREGRRELPGLEGVCGGQALERVLPGVLLKPRGLQKPGAPCSARASSGSSSGSGSGSSSPVRDAGWAGGCQKERGETPALTKLRPAASARPPWAQRLH